MSGGYDATLFARIAAAEPESFWFRARSRLIVDLVRRHFPDARSLLELGAGTGGVLAALREAFPDLRLVGVEPYAEGLAVAARRLPSDVELVALDARDLRYEDEFDVVGAFDVLEHVEDDEHVLGRMAAAARSGGGAILLAPQHPRLWSDMDRVARHVRRYRRRELVHRVRAAGLEPVYAGSFVSALLPAMVASRAVRHALGRPYDPVAELVPGRLNPFFERILDAERRAIGAGVRLPFGSSLVVVARKS